MGSNLPSKELQGVKPDVLHGVKANRINSRLTLSQVGYSSAPGRAIMKSGEKREGGSVCVCE